MKKAEELFRSGLEKLGIKYTSGQIEQNMLLLNQLLIWSKKINLTAIKKPHDVVTKHLLDSIALLPIVLDCIDNSDNEIITVLDVGAGAGFPSLPLAIFLPDVHFSPLDSNNKKLSFIRSMSTQLQRPKVKAIHSRIQELQPEVPYSIITARAFADVNDLLTWLPKRCCDKKTEVLAMKGKVPDEEIETLRTSLLSSEWELIEVIPLEVPSLEAERCVLRLKQRGFD